MTWLRRLIFGCEHPDWLKQRNSSGILGLACVRCFLWRPANLELREKQRGLEQRYADGRKFQERGVVTPFRPRGQA